jgi:hypothetical protein
MPWARMREMGAWKGVVVGDEATKWNVRERNVAGMRVSRGKKLRGGQLLLLLADVGRAYLRIKEITSNGKSSRRRASSIVAPFSSPSSPLPQNSSPPWPSGHVTSDRSIIT